MKTTPGPGRISSLCLVLPQVAGRCGDGSFSSPSDYPQRPYICDEVRCRLATRSSKTDKGRPAARQPLPRNCLSPPRSRHSSTSTSSGQDVTKKKLAVAVYNHYKRVQMNRVRGNDVEARKVEHPARRARFSAPAKLATTGNAREDARRSLSPSSTPLPSPKPATSAKMSRTSSSSCLQAADGDVARAQSGIIYIDEIDKIGRKDEEPLHHPRRVSGEGRSAGAAQAARRHYRQHVPPQGRTQAPAPGVHHRRRDEHPSSSAVAHSSGLKKLSGAGSAESPRLQDPGRSRQEPGSRCRSIRATARLRAAPPGLSLEDLLKYGLIPRVRRPAFR